MKLHSRLRELFQKFDLFSTSQFLRYQSDGDYKTASGGICSLIVVLIFVILFMNTAIQTINMDIINWSSSDEVVFNPTPVQITVSPDTKFNFALTLLAIDLNNPNVRYFDVQLLERHFIGNGIILKKEIPLVKCTRQHFAATEELGKNADKLAIAKWLCPPLNYQFGLEGKYTSTSMKYLEANAKKCNATLDLTRRCATDAQIDFLLGILGRFTFSLHTINPLINPGSKNYLDYYLEDRNYITFSKQLGAVSNAFVEDYTIETDVSLLPYTDNVVDQGTIIPQLFQTIVYQITGTTYASFFIMKSGKSTSYVRSFNKVDSFFSYVGGLVGTILGLMLFMQRFTEMAYQLNLSERLFWYKEKEPNDFECFNICTYLVYLFYSIASYFGLCKKWQFMKKFDDCKDQIIEQLDIEFILHRFNFLEKAVEILFQQNQVYGLHLQKFDTLSRIKKRRKRYSLKHSVMQNEQQEKSNDQADPSDDSDETETKSKDQKNNKKNSMEKELINPIIDSSLNNINSAALERVSNNNLQDIKQINPIAKPKKIKKRKEKERLMRLKQQVRDGNDISRKIISGIDVALIENIHLPQDKKQIQFEQSQFNDFELVQVQNKEKVDVQGQFYFIS